MCLAGYLGRLIRKPSLSKLPKLLADLLSTGLRLAAEEGFICQAGKRP